MRNREIFKSINAIESAANIILKSSYLTAFTGAGISVESGIPPFRGENGLWSKYDPEILDINYFLHHPLESWKVINEIFYSYFETAEPNEAHRILAKWEISGLLKVIITQNIDNLHHRAGSKNIIEYHGNSRNLTCLSCKKVYPASQELLKSLPPRCSCGGLLKPDFVFFGEGIPEKAVIASKETVMKTDAMIVIGSTGEVYPAGMIPGEAREYGARIIEINLEPSNYTGSVTDMFIQMKASEALTLLDNRLKMQE